MSFLKNPTRRRQLAQPCPMCFEKYVFLFLKTSVLKNPTRRRQPAQPCPRFVKKCVVFEKSDPPEAAYTAVSGGCFSRVGLKTELSTHSNRRRTRLRAAHLFSHAKSTNLTKIGSKIQKSSFWKILQENWVDINFNVFSLYCPH